jgi:hypothetical protein
VGQALSPANRVRFANLLFGLKAAHPSMIVSATVAGTSGQLTDESVCPTSPANLFFHSF